ncbi:hypothetical protein ZWY2020_040433 [Hordeum vulgare]|nr:hypothetical protein ZWY2020_040433 [Hordeum vulgare]
MFTENHVTTLSARYIPIALEIATAESTEHITPRSWGSAVLAATYRGMCNGCQLSMAKSAILGCPLFLQLWSWERFSIGRPNIDVDHSYHVGNMLDGDDIDLPTFGLCWTRRKRRYASEQTRRAYTALNEQFDTYTGVIWQSYTKAARISRYPGGISVLCTTDRGYSMMKSKIIFDVFVEEMAQQRIMRQFGLRQLTPPPNTENLLSVVVHRYVILTIYYIFYSSMAYG